MNRGSGEPRPRHSPSDPRFNEAPIHESGKLRRNFDGTASVSLLQ